MQPATTGPVGRGSYVVKQGDCMASIASEVGIPWQTIWDHPANRELKSVREDPHVLFPGDRVFIPPRGLKEEARCTGRRHDFCVRNDQCQLKITVLSYEKPRANEPYHLIVDGVVKTGTLNGEGLL